MRLSPPSHKSWHWLALPLWSSPPGRRHCRPIATASASPANATVARCGRCSRAVRAKRDVKVLAIGSSSTVGVGASSPSAAYIARLETSLEGSLKGMDFDVVGRGLSGEVAQGAADRMKREVEETKPDLVVWQVGTNDALRHVSIDKFKTCLKTTLAWLAENKIDVVLIDPQYGDALTKDEYYEKVVAALAEVAREARVLLVDRFEAMRELHRERGDLFYLVLRQAASQRSRPPLHGRAAGAGHRRRPDASRCRADPAGLLSVVFYRSSASFQRRQRLFNFYPKKYVHPAGRRFLQRASKQYNIGAANSQSSPDPCGRLMAITTGEAPGRAPPDRRPVVLVTGGSRGIGLALARGFAARGHDLFLIARDAERLHEAAAAIATQCGVWVGVAPCDLAQPGAVPAMLAALDAAGCTVDILVNCAGVAASGSFIDNDAAAARMMRTLNIEVATDLMHACLPAMVARGRGGVLNVASLAGMTPMPYLALYGATKSYLIALSRAVATEVAGTGVTVSVLLPGPVDTGIFAQSLQASERRTALLLALSPEVVARTAIDGYLAGQTVITPGLLGSLCRLGLKLLPYQVLAPFVGRALRGSSAAALTTRPSRVLSSARRGPVGPPTTSVSDNAIAVASPR